jgi:hypothetical protein
LAFGVPPAAADTNETPKKTNAVIFGPHPSAQGVDECIKNWLCTEGYTVTKYVWGRGGRTASLANLKTIATDGFAVLVIITHGSSGSITVEDFATEAAAKAAYDAYRANDAYKAIRNELDYGAIEDPTPRDTRYCVGISAAGLSKLFGAKDTNSSIVAVVACNSWGLQTANKPKPFGAKEYLGFDGLLSNRDRAKGVRGFEVMGGPEGIPKRPVKPAFEGKMKHEGPGNTTLAPACTDHLPPKDAELPLNVKTDGKTLYETLMSRANAEIMSAEGCEAGISDQQWVGDCEHRFKVEPHKPGRLIFKVDPKKAISKNNDRWLIGNRHRMPKDLDEDCGDTRPVVDKCQFGESGLDSKACDPIEVPFRWCVWCGEKPAEVPEPRQTPEGMDDVPGDQSRGVPSGDPDAFVLYQDSPGPNTIFRVTDLPPNCTFQQVGDWYAHVIFRPDDGQIGQRYEVFFETFDDDGPRSERLITWDVLARSSELRAFDPLTGMDQQDLGEDTACPGETGDYSGVVVNSGNTIVTNVVVQSLGFQGPGVIPPEQVTINPAVINLMMPDDSFGLQVAVQTSPQQLPGEYTGRFLIRGQTQTGPVQAESFATLLVDNLPVISGPTTRARIVLGEAVQIPLTVNDPDGDALDFSLEYAPVDAVLHDGDSGGLTFEWRPREDDIGLWNVPVVADDGYRPAVHELLFEVVRSAGDGACCLPHGSCVAMSEEDCSGESGRYRGDGTSCDGIDCLVDVPATGPWGWVVLGLLLPAVGIAWLRRRERPTTARQ